MRTLFADTCYWIASANPRDAWHEWVRSAPQWLGPFHIVTTDEVLVEFLNFFGELGQRAREQAADAVRAILRSPTVRVLPQSRESFLAGLSLYEARSDKEYSHTDCVAMDAMRALGLADILTNDHHFEQEGFTILLKE
ncbi:MAG: type II toxin-antitoxin system VapC family toxin [Planctomycetes bacterium]|nr:type II toxin-antitoxin system VapC family toxin [Planctomycetota bacterium]